MGWFRLAIHEAGHAIVAHSYRRQILSVWATEHLGKCQTKPLEWRRRMVLARRELSIALAGNTAEQLHFGNTLRPGLHDCQVAHADLFAHPESDEAKAATVAKWIARAKTAVRVDAVAEIRRAEIAAQRILMGRWREVLLLARSIRHRKGGRLTGEDLSKLIRVHRRKTTMALGQEP